MGHSIGGRPSATHCAYSAWLAGVAENRPKIERRRRKRDEGLVVGDACALCGDFVDELARDRDGALGVADDDVVRIDRDADAGETGAAARWAFSARVTCDPLLLLALVDLRGLRRRRRPGHHRRVLASDLCRIFLQHARHVLRSRAERDLVGTALDRLAQRLGGSLRRFRSRARFGSTSFGRCRR